MDHLDIVADFATSLRFQDLPREVVDRAKLLLLDSFGVMLAGSREGRVQSMTKLLRSRGSTGRSTFASDGRGGDAADAALVNAVAACAHVLDEGHKYARGHVATYVLPSVLAVAEERQVSGAEFLAALVAAYEIAARMGMACRVRATMHPSGTWGTVGAAAVVARLMKLEPGQVREAMNVAAPLTLATSWEAAVEGATVRDLYSGYGAMNAVWVPRWVAAGFTGSHDDVAHVFGKVSSERFDAAALTDGLGSRWEIRRNYFKVHACCRNFQSGIDAALELKREYKFEAADVAAVRADTFAVPARDNASAEPRNVLAAKESFPVSLALTLIHGNCDQSVFTDAKVYDHETRRIAANVTVACDPELDTLYPEQRPSRITIELRDGRKLSGYAAVALGDPMKPIPREDLEAKYFAAASPSLADGAEHLKRSVEQAEHLASVGELTRALQADNESPLRRGVRS